MIRFMEFAIHVTILIYAFCALIAGASFLIVDIRNNLSYGHLGLLHTLARLPIVLLFSPLFVCDWLYRAVATKK